MSKPTTTTVLLESIGSNTNPRFPGFSAQLHARGGGQSASHALADALAAHLRVAFPNQGANQARRRGGSGQIHLTVGPSRGIDVAKPRLMVAKLEAAVASVGAPFQALAAIDWIAADELGHYLNGHHTALIADPVLLASHLERLRTVWVPLLPHFLADARAIGIRHPDEVIATHRSLPALELLVLNDLLKLSGNSFEALPVRYGPLTRWLANYGPAAAFGALAGLEAKGYIGIDGPLDPGHVVVRRAARGMRLNPELMLDL